MLNHPEMYQAEHKKKHVYSIYLILLLKIIDLLLMFLFADLNISIHIIQQPFACKIGN